MTEREEQLARVVHGAVAFGASAAEAVRLSGGSLPVLALAITFVDPNESTPVGWQDVIRVLQAAIAAVRSAEDEPG